MNANRSATRRLLARVCAASAMLLLFGCGGGGGTTVALDGVIGGTGIKGPVANATVNAYAITNGQMGTQIGTATTDASGNFNLSIGTYAGSVMLQLRGGTYTDEATGNTMPMASGDVMSCLVTGVSAGATVDGIQLTPLTSMAQTMAQSMSGGMTDANISAANTAVGQLYAVNDIVHTRPINPLASGSGANANQNAVNYGMVLAAMSEYAHSLGLSYSSAVVTAMMNDASDGTLDGKMGTGTVMLGGMNMAANAATGGLAGAMSTFLASGQNRSGVTASTMQSLMNQLNGSSGQMGGGSMQNGMIGGSGTKGPVAGVMVTAYAIGNGQMGAQIGATTTDANGNFSLSIGSYAGAVMLKLTGGTYTDEATGTTMAMANGDVMTAVLNNIAAGTTLSGIQVTPLTSMAQVMAQDMSGGMTGANITAANAAVGNFFSVDDILTTRPMNPLTAGSGAQANLSMQHYGLALAAMSQYAQSLGLSSSSAVVTAMMNDAADGIMNGLNGNSPVTMGSGMGGGSMGGGGMMQANAGTSGMATAMTTFMNSSENRSGLTAADMSALIQQLMGSTGRIQP